MRFSKILSEVPYKLRKRINKTAEGRSGLEIYKRRNRRDYRVIIQYKTWIYLLESNPSKLDVYEEGFVVMITPAEYFGDNYPNESSVLNKNFVLGKTGFIYYGNVVELNNFPPLDNWKEVLELSTTGISEKGQTWLGDVVFNVKNAKPSKVSIICKNDKSKTKEEKEKVDQLLNSQYSHITLGKNPSQSGLGNYDFDYANRDMMDNVKMQMLYLAVKSKSIDGHSFDDYVVNNFNELETPDDARIKRSIEKNEYRKNLNKAIKSLEKQAIEKGLLDYKKFSEKGIWNTTQDYLSCPLCGKEIYVEDFFEEVEQQEGREVFDNTQRSIVLMHIKALRPGEFNHSTYNLGWGHNYCNLIQGDKDIDDTISMLEEIIINYKKHTKI